MLLLKKTTILLFIFITAFFVNTHFSLARGKSKAMHEEPSNKEAASSDEEHGSWYGHSSNWRVQAGASYGLLDGQSSGYGLTFAYWRQMEEDLPWFFSVESGYDHYSTAPLTTWTIPILFGAKYEFTLSKSKLHPYVGFSFGPAITKISGTTAGGAKVDLSSVYMEWLLTPIGVRYNQFFVEPRLGMAQDSQVFALTAGIFL